MMIKILSVILCLILTSCSSLEVRTNAGSFLRGKISSNVVEQYTLQEIRYFEGDFLTSVTSSQCINQVDEFTTESDYFPANNNFSRSHLISELQVNTQLQGGNALVVHSCNIAANADCYKYMQCNGSAYWVESGK